MSKDYIEKLKDPRWQKKRLEILERDDWSCQCCGDDKNTLHVHHKYYEKSKDPWDYDSDYLITLCTDCHDNESLYEHCKIELIKELAKDFLNSDFQSLLIGFHFREMVHSPKVDAEMLSWFLQNNEEQKQLEEKYFAHLKAEFDKKREKDMVNAK